MFHFMCKADGANINIQFFSDLLGNTDVHISSIQGWKKIYCMVPVLCEIAMRLIDIRPNEFEYQLYIRV